MLALTKLLTKPVAQGVVEGVWQVAQLQIDPATGERLNVGVVFVEKLNGNATVRFLRSVAGIRCLYNDDMADDASFLIDQAEQAFEQGIQLPVGWNIQLSRPLVARGENAQAVVNRLFARMVPLGLKEQLEDRLDTDDHLHTTANVRKVVRDLMKKHLQTKEAPDFWTNKPISSMQSGHEVQVDLQISGQGRVGHHCGTIASAWYKTKFHRNAYLDKASSTAIKAKQLYPNASVLVYLLTPQGDIHFSAEEHGQIQIDIESARWMVEERGASLALFGDARSMAQQILQDMAVI